MMTPMQQARQLALEHGIDIDPTVGGWWVIHPELVDHESDPLDEHFCHTEVEVLQCVQAYVHNYATTQPGVHKEGGK